MTGEGTPEAARPAGGNDKPCTVWGLAAGRGSTAEAAHGAFTVREYPDGKYDSRDWLRVISVVREDDSRGNTT